VASELKALEGYCTKTTVPPGHYMTSKDGEFVQWYKREWTDYDAVKDNETSIPAIKEALAAVHRQLMSDVPYGVLLSGGLDSSVTSAIAKKYAQKRIESGDVLMRGIHNYTLFSGAGRVSGFSSRANSGRSYRNHPPRNKFYNPRIDAIRDVIYNLETYDVTTIRASTPMVDGESYKSMGIKMVLSGEGADELLRVFVFPQSTKRKRISKKMFVN
jgi:asparagine synthase (glutamine-hydrolysing)